MVSRSRSLKGRENIYILWQPDSFVSPMYIFSRISWFTAKNNSVSYGDIMHDLLSFGNVQFTYTRSIERRESPSTVKLRLEPAELYDFFFLCGDCCEGMKINMNTTQYYMTILSSLISLNIYTDNTTKYYLFFKNKKKQTKYYYPT